MDKLPEQIYNLLPKDIEPRCTCDDLTKMRTFCPVHEKEEIERMNKFAASARRSWHQPLPNPQPFSWETIEQVYDDHQNNPINKPGRCITKIIHPL